MLTLSEAAPPTRSLVPNVVVPSRKYTFPVADDGITLAVRTTVWLGEDGLKEEVIVVVVVSVLTTWLSAVDVLVGNVPSPAYSAVMACVPAESVAETNTAMPFDRLKLPRDLSRSRNVTTPVAVAGETVAVKVTLCPYFEGFGEEVT